jgi:hypothetical protein
MTAATKTGQSLKEEPRRFALRFEWTIALLLTAAALVLHIRYFLHAGALWRDEITSVNLANTHSFADAVANMDNDSFPILWICIVRLWEHLGIGQTDSGMRVLGLLAGVGILAALWRNARRLGVNTPVVSVALLSFTSSVICYGDSVRGYGLGMFLGLCTFGLVWDLTQRPTPMRFAAALAGALLSVHMLFYNCVLLLAAGCGAAAVTIPKRQWKRAALVLIIGLICATSMLVYLPMIQRTRGLMMFQIRLDFPWLMTRLRESLRFATEGDVSAGNNDIVWGVVIVIAILLAVGAACAGALRSASQRRRDGVVFCAACLIAGIFAYWGFLEILRYAMEPWYFLGAMAMAATCLDGLFGAIRSSGFRVLLAICAAGFARTSAVPVWKNVAIRRTNVDIIAARLQTMAPEGDVIVVDPWYIGVTFNRYYHGKLEWTTIPPVSFFDYQEYRQLPKYIADRRAVDPLIRKLSEVLRGGHRVWVVTGGWLPVVPPGAPFFQRIPDPVSGWNVGASESSWSQEVLYALRRNSKRVRSVAIPDDQTISRFEPLQVWCVEGWAPQN